MPTFKLDPQLENDTFEICNLEICTCRLMNDSRYPWIILIPMQKNLVELIDLSKKDRIKVWEEIACVSETLQTIYQPHKLNVAALGNQTRQLHIHIIARKQTDFAWPQPVWGVGKTKNYAEQQKSVTLNTLKGALHARN